MQPRTFPGVLVPFQANALDGVWIAAALTISVAATLIFARAASRKIGAQNDGIPLFSANYKADWSYWLSVTAEQFAEKVVSVFRG